MVWGSRFGSLLYSLNVLLRVFHSSSVNAGLGLKASRLVIDEIMEFDGLEHSRNNAILLQFKMEDYASFASNQENKGNHDKVFELINVTARAAKEIIEYHGGSICNFIGDGLLASFVSA